MSTVTPRITICITRVRITGCTPTLEMRKPLNTPMAAQAARPIRHQTQKFPPLVIPRDTMMPQNAIMDPVEISIPPELITKVIPTVMNKMGVDCLITSHRVLRDKKFFVTIPLKTISTARAITAP